MLIPSWLSHLPVHRGLPVPWVNAWGREPLVDDPDYATRVRVEHDPVIGKPALFVDDDPHGAPDFGRQHLARQRQAWWEGRCQVCGKPVAWSRRNIVLASTTTETITLPPSQRLGHLLPERVPVVFEPWLCDRCCALAVEVCPELIRRRRDEELTVVQVRRPADVILVLSHGYPDGPLEQRARDLNAAMWCKAILTRVPLTLVPAVS